MGLHDWAFAILGAGGCLLAQAFAATARRLLGLRSAAEKSEALRVEAVRRAADVEERLRLAECEIAARGGSAAPSKRVNVRPL